MTPSRCGGKLAAGMSALPRDLWHSADGVILPYVTVLLTFIVGLSVLALDGARVQSLQAQLQKGADALALAGALELDGTSTSTTRATNAINNTGSTWVLNRTLFGNANVAVANITFYSGLPAGSVSPIPSSYETTDSPKARFVKVRVQPVTLGTILPASIFGGADSITTGAEAVAGYNPTICQTTALFMCNPFETVGMTYDQATQALITASGTAASKRRLVRLKASNQDSPPSYTPGNFGYVQPAANSVLTRYCGSGDDTAQAAAQVAPNVCVNQSAVDLRTGNAQPVIDAFSVRMDYFRGSFTNCATDANGLYPPDVSVRKGFTPGSGANPQCQANVSNEWPAVSVPNSGGFNTGFPLDNNMLDSTGAQSITTAIGDGNWMCGNITVPTNALTARGNPANCSNGCKTLNFASGSTAGIYVGMPISTATAGSTIPTNAYVVSKTATTVTMSSATAGTGTAVASGASIKFQGYWDTAHPPALNHSAPTGCQGAGTPPYATISRYDVYQYEISQAWTNDASSGGEVGGTYCSTTAPVADRRKLNLAFVNCLSVSGNTSPNAVTLNGSAQDVPVAAFGDMFLSLPAQDTHDEPYGEFRGFVASGGNNFKNVQLYR